MSAQWYFSYLKTHFQPEVISDLIKAYRQDPLVWKTINTIEHPEDWIAIAGDTLFNWQVSKFALFTLDPSLLNFNWRDLDNDLPEEIHQKSERFLETIRMIGLEPNNLSDAALLAIALREHLIRNDGWEGLSDFIFLNNKRLDVWKTAFVVLPGLVPDTEGAFFELIDACGSNHYQELASLIIHSVQTFAIEEEQRYQTYQALLNDSPLDFQISFLQTLQTRENSSLVRLLAKFVLDSVPFETGLKNTLEELETTRKTGILQQIAGLDQESIESIQSAKDGFQSLRASFLRDIAKNFELTQPEEARKSWEDVLTIDQDNEDHISEYAEFLIHEGDVHQALYLLNTLNNRKPVWLFSLRYPEFAAIQAGNGFHLDLDQLSQVISNEKSRFLPYSDKFLAARMAFENKDFDLARDFADKALLETPNDVETIKLCGCIHQRLANLKEAIENFELLKSLEPANPEYKTELTHLYIKAQEPQKALETYTELIHAKSQPTREESLFYADLSIEAGQPEIAIPIAQEFLNQDEFDGEAMVTLAKALIHCDRVDEARNLLTHASALAPEKAESWLALSRIWMILGEQDQALVALQKARVATPDHPQILTALGKLYLDQDQASEAAAVLKQAAQIEPENMAANIALTSALLKQGNIEEAWQTIQSYENDYSSDPELALVLADALAAKGEPQRAISVYKFAWQSLRSNESLQSYLGALLELAKQEPDTENRTVQDLSDLLPALQERNATYDATFEMKLLESDIKTQLGMLEEAYEDYLYLLDLPEAKAPRFYQHLQRQIGLVALELGFEDISLASLQEAIAFNADDLASRHALSTAYQKSGLSEKAIESAQTALQLAPTEISNVLWYSKFMQANSRPHDAIQALKDAIFSKPQEQILHLSLARMYLANNAVDESKITLSKMLETSDLSTADYLNIAQLYKKMDEKQLATEILQRAISENKPLSFSECCEIVYTLLELNQSGIALDFVNGISQKHGQLSSYALLRADVLTAEKEFLKALEVLEPVLDWINQGRTEIQSTFSPEPDSGYYTYDNTGAFLRAAQLQRVIANYKRAKDLTNQALTCEPTNTQAQILSCELALAVQDKTSLNDFLEKLNSKGSLTDADIEIAKLIILDALLDNELTKANLLCEHLIPKNDQDMITSAASALVAESEGQEHQMMALLQIIKDGPSLIQDPKMEPQTLFEQFRQIWRDLSVAIVAAKAHDWQLADQMFNQCLCVYKTNPRVNLAFSEYLIEKAIARSNAIALMVQKHMPPATSPNVNDETLFDEQITQAKRFIDTENLNSLETVGKALFRSKPEQLPEIDKLSLNNQLARALIVLIENPSQTSKILAEFSHDSSIRWQYAIRQLEKHPAQALDILSSLPIKPGQQAVHFAALSFAQKSDPATAEDSITRALAIYPDEPEWWFRCTSFQQTQEKYAEASHSLNEALKLDPENARYWQALGEVNCLKKDLVSARTFYEKANTIRPDNAPVLEALSEINRKLGETQAAISSMKSLHALYPNELSYLESLAELHLAIQDYDSALEYANKVIDTSLNCERALKVKIETLVARQSYEEAKKLAQDAMLIAKDPISFEIYRIRIEARQNPTLGLKLSASLALEHPDYPSVLNLLAQYQLLADQTQNAEKTLLKSLQIQADNAETLLALGALNRLKGQHDFAQNFLNKAIEIDPGLIEAYLELGLSFEDQRKTDQALQVYNKAIEHVSKDPRPYVHAANAYKSNRDYRSAELMLQQAAQLAPTDQSIRRQLSSIVAQNLLNNLQEAPKRK